jgi:hypothetical protein
MQFRHLLALIAIVLVSCQSREQDGLTVAEDYLEIPTSAQAVNAYYAGEGQYRAVYLKFGLPNANLDDFLSTTCFDKSEGLANAEIPFQDIDPSELGLPSWWIPNAVSVYFAEECITNNVSYAVSISKDDAIDILFLRLILP